MTFGDILAYFGALFGGVFSFILFVIGVALIIGIGSWIVGTAGILFLAGLFEVIKFFVELF